MAFITDEQAVAYGLDPTDEAGTRRVLADSGAVYEYLNSPEQAWAPRGTLDKWAEGQWGDEGPDRLNAALALLVAAGKVFDVGQVSRQTPITST